MIHKNIYEILRSIVVLDITPYSSSKVNPELVTRFMLVSCLVCPSTQKMEATYSFASYVGH
jgi:hypothetical protein